MNPAPGDSDGLRGRFLHTAVAFGVLVWLSTELLGAFSLLGRIALSVWWAAVALAACAIIRRRRSGFRLSIPRALKDPIVILCLAGLALIFSLTAVTAAFSPPNSTDAMAYHMPRVLYWAEQSSVGFFPTPYLNQIMLQPLAEYFMLHLYLLSSGDRFINFVQWFGWLGCVAGVSLVARMFGARARGQAFAALFCATLPSGILASSGAKNDCLLALWLVACVWFALRFRADRSLRNAAWLGAALGLALLTKATAYLFVPWPIVAIVPKARFPVRGVALAAGIALAINAPQYVRNYRLSGSVLGFDSAQADGFFRWRNETFGWRQTASNIMRNTSEQLGLGNTAWNNGVYSFFAGLHRRLGIDPNDPATTWRWTTWQAPRNSNHEADAPNPWHDEILLIVCCFLVVRALRGDPPLPAVYALSLVAGFLAFCLYLKWQPFQARLFLPLFVMASPLVALLEPVVRPGRLRTIQTLTLCALSLFLPDVARHPVLDNWVRPLRGPLSVLTRSRDAQYFADMTQWNNAPSFQETVKRLSASNCMDIGVDITDFQPEYPLEALLLERKPGATFVHTGTDNPSRRFPQPAGVAVCAVVCLECAGDEKRLARYRDFGPPALIGRFALFTK